MKSKHGVPISLIAGVVLMLTVPAVIVGAGLGPGTNPHSPPARHASRPKLSMAPPGALRARIVSWRGSPYFYVVKTSRRSAVRSLIRSINGQRMTPTLSGPGVLAASELCPGRPARSGSDLTLYYGGRRRFWVAAACSHFIAQFHESRYFLFPDGRRRIFDALLGVFLHLCPKNHCRHSLIPPFYPPGVSPNF